MDLVQTDFRERRLPVECIWKTAILLTKGNVNFQFIVLVEVIWKTISGIINQQIGTAVLFHDILHGFHAVREMGTASLEANLIQHLMEIREELLYEVFLDLRKSYNALDI